MSVRFKFRSSVSFDSIDIEGRPSISVRDLKSRIIRQKKLNICQDSDLVFSDALTGREYNDENFQIPGGSSVIIKRVPAGSVPSAKLPINPVENYELRNCSFVNSVPHLPLKEEVDNFDDFGIDLCPVPEAALSDSDLEFDTNSRSSNGKLNITFPREGYQKLEGSGLSEAIPSPNLDGTDRTTSQGQTGPNNNQPVKFQKMADAEFPALNGADFPSELKCSLCNTFFKEAVMIPCCQHSFCEKCVRIVLGEKARCPKCYSSKCKVEDLLPNLSLRQAIEHFLESQGIMSGADNAFQKYAPDGESGIQAKDFSCAVTVLQREPNMPLSSSATEKGSNQEVMAESVCESGIRRNASLGGSGFVASKDFKTAPMLPKLKQMDGERVGYAHHDNFQRVAQNLDTVPDFQGESHPHGLHQRRPYEEVDSTTNKNRGLWVHTGGGGGDRNILANGRQRKGDRTCYMCGSPDHLIRDCPAASSPHPMLQTGNAVFPGAVSGYAAPFWNSTPFPPMRPFTNAYGNCGMMPFNTAMVPASPFTVSPYMPSIYGRLPGPSGFMRMGGMAPQLRTASHSDNSELHDFENGWKLPNENLGRAHPYDDEDDDYNKRSHHNEPERSRNSKSRKQGEDCASYSDDSFNGRSQRKQRHDEYIDRDKHVVDERRDKNVSSAYIGRDQLERRHCHLERTISGVDDMPSSSGRRSEERHKHHLHRSPKKHDRKDQCGSDSSRSRRQTEKEKDFGRKRIESDIEGPRQKHHSHAEYAVEPSSLVDHKKACKEKDRSHSSRHSRSSTKPISDEVSNDRWHMTSGTDDDYGEGYRHHKRKRVH